MEKGKKQIGVPGWIASINPIRVTKWILIGTFLVYIFLNQMQFLGNGGSFQSFMLENPMNALGLIVACLGILSAGLLQVLQNRMGKDEFNQTVGSFILLFLTLTMIFSQNYLATAGMVLAIIKQSKILSFSPSFLFLSFKESNLKGYFLASIGLCFLSAICFFVN